MYAGPLRDIPGFWRHFFGLSTSASNVFDGPSSNPSPNPNLTRLAPLEIAGPCAFAPSHGGPEWRYQISEMQVIEILQDPLANKVITLGKRDTLTYYSLCIICSKIFTS